MTGTSQSRLAKVPFGFQSRFTSHVGFLAYPMGINNEVWSEMRRRSLLKMDEGLPKDGQGAFSSRRRGRFTTCINNSLYQFWNLTIHCQESAQFR